MGMSWVRRGSGALGALLLVVACRVEVAPPPKKATAANRASAAPSASLKPKRVLPPQPLLPPPGESTKLAGKVSIDAAYMVAAGAGNLLPRAGAPIVAAGAGNLVGPDGASLVGPDGASLVGPDGASLVGPDGATLVAAGGGNMVAAGGLNLIGLDGASLVGPDGASLVGPDGASLVGPDGASLVGPDGASLVAAGRASYTLAQDQAPAAGEAGRLLPAAAMRVGVVDLRTGRPVSVGVDAQGNPVEAVYSNFEGGFELFVPKDLAGYVRVVAYAPARDQRLFYDAIVRADAEPDDIDEDTAMVGRFLRSAFATRFEQLLSLTPAALEAGLEPPKSLNPADPNYFQTFGRPMLLYFGELSRRRGFDRMDPVKRRAIAQVAADRLLAACDFTNVTTADQVLTYVPANPNELALDAYRDAMRRIRTDAGVPFQELGAAGFSARLQQVTGKRLPGITTFDIQKPTDLPAFILNAFLANRREGADIGGEADAARMMEAERLLEDLGILSQEDRVGRMRAAGRALVFHMLYVFKFKDNPDPATVEYGPVGQGIIDYLWTVETGVSSDLGRPSPAPAAPGGT